MTESKFEEMLINLAELLKEKKSELWFKSFYLEQAEKKLQEAEAKIKDLLNIEDSSEDEKTEGERE